MDRYERRATAQEISTLPPQPGYLTSVGRRNDDCEKRYCQACLKLLNDEIKRHPGFKIRMSIKNGVPYFSGYRRSYTDQAIARKITRSLNRYRAGIKAGVLHDTLKRRMDRLIEKYSE